MTYTWREDLLPVGEPANRPGHRINPAGLVLHSTGNRRPGADARMHRRLFGREYREASAHTFIDWHQALRIIPDGLGPDPAEKAWHAGRTANRLYLGYELCETDTSSDFVASYGRFVWAAADCLLYYGWGLDHVWSHRQISERHPAETDHVDPDPYLKRWGQTWEGLLADIGKEQARRRAAAAVKVPVYLPDGRALQGELRDGKTWAEVAGVWVPVRAWAECLGAKVEWIAPEAGGPRVNITLGGC